MVPEDQPMESITDGAVAGPSPEQYPSASGAVARPSLEQYKQPSGHDTDHEMVSASSSRASPLQAASTSGRVQTRAQAARERETQEREIARKREIARAAANNELARDFEDPGLSDDERDQ